MTDLSALALIPWPSAGDSRARDIELLTTIIRRYHADAPIKLIEAAEYSGRDFHLAEIYDRDFEQINATDIFDYLAESLPKIVDAATIAGVGGKTVGIIINDDTGDTFDAATILAALLGRWLTEEDL